MHVRLHCVCGGLHTSLTQSQLHPNPLKVLESCWDMAFSNTANSCLRRLCPDMLYSAQAAKAAKSSMSHLTSLPTHIARIQKTGDDHIICGAISSDGSALAFSDRQGLHLYQLSSQHDADEPDNTSAMDAETDEPDLAVSKAVMTVQPVASGRDGRKLMRLNAPEDLPSFVELQYRPGCAQVIGLTPQGTLVVVDTQAAAVRSFADTHMDLLLFGRSLLGGQQTIHLGRFPQ